MKTLGKLALPLFFLFYFAQVQAQQKPWFQWAQGMSTAIQSNGSAIVNDGNGMVWVAGTKNASSFGTFGSISIPPSPGFLIRQDINGNVISGYVLPFSNIADMEISGNFLYLSGTFTGTVSYQSFTITANANSNDIWLAKMDFNGNCIWLKKGGGNGAELCQGLAADAAGNAYVTGTYSAVATFGSLSLPAGGGQTAFLVKYDANGVEQWALKFSSTNLCTPRGLDCDPAGNVGIVGQFAGNAVFQQTTLSAVSNTNDAFIGSYTPQGAQNWISHIAGSGNDAFQEISADNAGNWYCTGNFTGPGSVTIAPLAPVNYPSTALTDLATARVNANGQAQWFHMQGTAGTDGGFSIDCNASGHVYTCGYFSNTLSLGSTSLTSIGGTDLFIAKLDAATGQYLWAQQAGSPGNGQDWMNSISVDGEGNAFTTGSSSSGSASFGPQITLSLANTNYMFTSRINDLSLPNLNPSYCHASFVSTPFVVTGTFHPGNFFSVQLSDNTGSFANPTILASSFSQTSGTINFTLPLAVSGPLYKMRLVATNMQTVGAPYNTPILPGGSNNLIVTANASPSPFCAGNGPSTLTASGANTYSWAPNVNLSSTTGNPITANPAVTTNYTVTGTSGSCTGTAVVQVQVLPSPNASITASQVSTCGNSGSGTQLTANGGFFYSWSPAAGLNTTSGATVIANPTTTTTYTVTVSNFLGCSSTASYTVNPSLTNPMQWCWANQLGAGNLEHGNDVAVDASGNVWVVGSIRGTITINNVTYPAGGGTDVFIAKYNSAGVIQDFQRMGSLGNDVGKGITIDPSGNVIITGNYSNFIGFGSFVLNNSGIGRDIFVAKYNPVTSSWVWAKHFNGNNNSNIGNDVTTDAGGNVFVIGAFSGTVSPITTLTSSGVDVVIARLAAASGNFLWAQKAGGSGNDYGNDITRDAFSRIYVTGTFQTPSGTASFGSFTLSSSGGSNDAFVGRLNTSGTWGYAIPIGGANDQTGASVAVDAAGNVLVSGVFTTSATVGTNNYTSVMADDYFLASFNLFGGFRWSRQMGGAGFYKGNGVESDASNNFYFGATYDFTATVGSYSLTSCQYDNVYISKLSNLGSVLWVERADGDYYHRLNAVAPMPGGDVVATGTLWDQAIFDNTVLQTVPIQQPDMWVGKLCPNVPATLSTGTITGSPFCAGQTIQVPFTATGVFNLGNQFEAWLSDASGNFASEVLIGTGSTSPITATLPASASGSQYRIRVKSTNPAITAADNGVDLVIQLPNLLALFTTSNCLTASTTITASGAQTYVWSPSAGLNTTTGPVVVASPAVTTTYTVTGTDVNGCTSTGTIIVNAAPSAAHPWCWAAQGQGAGIEAGWAVAQDANGNVYVAGKYQGGLNFGILPPLASLGANDIFVACFDAAGVPQWSTSAGGMGDDAALSIAVVAPNQVIVGGYMEGNANFPPLSATNAGAGKGAFVGQYNHGSGWTWLRISNGSDPSNEVHSVAVDPNTGAVYAAGAYGSTVNFGSGAINSAGGSDAFLAKFSSSGVPQWAQSAGGGSWDDAKSVALDLAGNTYIYGQFENYFNIPANFGSFPMNANGTSDVFLVKYDAAGTALWARQYGDAGAEVAGSMAADLSGNTYFSGLFNFTTTIGSSNLNSSGSEDYFIGSVDGTGLFRWAKAAPGAGLFKGHHLDVDANGLVYFAGTFDGSITLGSDTYTSCQFDNVYVMSLDALGNLQWSTAAYGNYYTVVRGLCANDGGEVWATGTVNGDANFYQTLLTSTGGQTNADPWIAKICASNKTQAGSTVHEPIEVSAEPAGTGMLLFPNPASGTELNVRLNDTELGQGRLRVLSLRGEVLHEQVMEGAEAKVTFSTPLPAGVYVVEVRAAEGTWRSRWTRVRGDY